MGHFKNAQTLTWVGSCFREHRHLDKFDPFGGGGGGESLNAWLQTLASPTPRSRKENHDQGIILLHDLLFVLLQRLSFNKRRRVP
jgi:hypothetical protein